MESFGTLQIEDKYVCINFGEHQKKRFYYIWLRDHCKYIVELMCVSVKEKKEELNLESLLICLNEIKLGTNDSCRTKPWALLFLNIGRLLDDDRGVALCEECYSKFYNQILFNIADIPLDIKPSSCAIVKDVLSITWMDGHKTIYDMKWLESISFPFKPVLDTILWDNKLITQSLKKIPIESYFNDTNGTDRLIDAIRKYGFGIVSGVENTLEATEKVVTHFTSVHKTCFGEMWKVSTYSTLNDTSSSTIALLPHNDNTYWTNATGLIIFHLLHRNGEGGQTILVDGFNVAEKVRSKNPDAFNLLCNAPIESHFIDKSQHYFHTESVIKLHSVTKQLYQIRFNVYDRSPLVSLSEEMIPKYYEAYQLFAKEAFDPKNRLEIQLEPGDVLFVDNWRILHGRNAFIGERELGGCYVSRDDYISQVKKFDPNVH